MNNEAKKNWKKIYELMADIKSLKPWKYLYNNVPVVIRSFFDEDVYITVMGNGGDVTGFIIYDNPREFFKAYCQYFHRVNNGVEMFTVSHDSIYAAWGDREEVTDESYALIKELGLKFRGNGNWLYLEKYGKRRIPRIPDDNEAAKLLKIFEIFEKACIKIPTLGADIYVNNICVDVKKDDNGNPFVKLFPTDFLKDAEKYLTIEIEDNDLISDIKKMKSKKYTAEVNIFYENYPTVNEKGEEVFSEFFAAANKRSGETVGIGMNDDPDVPEYAFLLDSVAEMCKNAGKPEKIIVCDKFIEYTLKNFCDKIGTKLEYSEKPLDKVTESFESNNSKINNFLNEAIKQMGEGKISSSDDLMDMFMNIFEQGSSQPQITMTSKKPKKKASGKRTLAKYQDKSFKISVSLGKGIYKHIIISAGSSFGDLHEVILDAFDFDDDHLHQFYLDDKPFSSAGQLYDEDDMNDNSYNYCLGDHLHEGMKFLFLFDFGDEWHFECKVLKSLDTPCKKAEVVKSVGENPEQYPDYDDFDEDEDEDDEDKE